MDRQWPVGLSEDVYDTVITPGPRWTNNPNRNYLFKRCESLLSRFVLTFKRSLQCTSRTVSGHFRLSLQTEANRLYLYQFPKSQSKIRTTSPTVKPSGIGKSSAILLCSDPVMRHSHLQSHARISFRISTNFSSMYHLHWDLGLQSHIAVRHWFTRDSTRSKNSAVVLNDSKMTCSSSFTYSLIKNVSTPYLM